MGFCGQYSYNSPLESITNVPATSELSDKVSKDLKKRGFKFFGSTITYAHLQATGIMNDFIKAALNI